MAYTSPTYSFAPCRAAPFTDNKDSFTPLYSDLTELAPPPIDITAIATDTYGGLCQKIFNGIDTSKLRITSKVHSPNGWVFTVRMVGSSQIRFDFRYLIHASEFITYSNNYRWFVQNYDGNTKLWTQTETTSDTIISDYVGIWKVYY